MYNVEYSDLTSMYNVQHNEFWASVYVYTVKYSDPRSPLIVCWQGFLAEQPILWQTSSRSNWFYSTSFYI